MSSAVLRLDDRGTVVVANRAAGELLGNRRLLGRPLGEVYRLEDPSGTTALDDQRLDRPRAQVSGRLVRADGVVFTVRERWAAIDDDPAAGGWLILEDLTELRALQQEQEWLAFHDQVTGLDNRRSFERHLVATLAVAGDDSELAVGYLDLDDVAPITETWGQVACDELLRQVARLLRGLLGEQDFLARLDDSRFGLLIHDCPQDAIAPRAQSLREAIAGFRFSWQQERFLLGASVGMVPVERGRNEVVQVLAAADAASSLARDESVAIHQFNADNSMDLRLAGHYGDMRWLSQIHRSLKKGRFQLFRQPIVPTERPDPAHAPLYEVLLRMVDEDGDLVLPGQFIPAAERFRMIAVLDRWVVRAALTELADDAADFAIAINVSGQSVSEASFLRDVVELLEETHVPPTRVCFEITETAAVGNLRRALRFIHSLRERGCRFVLDDFGSGLSSFAYLRDLPVEFLKIDGTFVTDMVDDSVLRTIVEAIHKVGSTMGIRTIAEYVENERTLAALAEMGVDFAQGFGIQTPQPWTAFPDP